MADSLTHKDLAELCGVSETTIKSYRRKFPGFIPVLTRGKPIRFRPEAGEVCLRIRQCFEKGLSVTETENVLAREFRKEPSSMPGATPTASKGVAPPERLDEFFAHATRMMQGMAALATAQAKSDRRLEQVEQGLARLIEVETENKELLGDLVRAMGERARSEPAAATAAKKIVTVRKPTGQSATYAFGAEVDERPETKTPAEPDAAFLDTPVVIQSDQGHYLGLPGGKPVRDFVRAVAERFEGTGSWAETDTGWRFDVSLDLDEPHGLNFRETTTPKGNNVIHFHRLDRDGAPQPTPLLQDLFRRSKRWL